MTCSKPYARLSVAAPVFCLVAACGGGGGGASAPTAVPDAPVVSTAIGVKQLVLSWSAVSGAASYKVYANPAGVTGYAQIGTDTTATSYTIDIPVHRFDWANARYLVEACNALGCTGSNEVAGGGSAAQAIGYLKASAVDLADFFGTAVAVSGDGNTVAIGAPFEDSNATGINGASTDNSAANAGAVYVYARTAGTWALQAYIKPATIHAGDTFGSAVALSDNGNTLAVGSPSEDSSDTGINGNAADTAASASGAAYVFTRSGTTWSQQAYLKASNTGAGDTFGATLAISADGATLAVGAYGEDSAAQGIDGDQASNTALGAGAAYVFIRSGSTWSQQAYIKASNTGASDFFAIALDISDDGATLAVGAIGEASFGFGINADQNDNVADGAGAVYVYTRSGASWTQQAYIKASNTDAYDTFGRSVALSDDGNTLAVSATGEDSEATGVGGNQGGFSADASGAVYVFTRSGSAWSQQAYLKASNTGASDSFGQSIALSNDGDTLAVCAPAEDSAATAINGNEADNNADGAGAVYLFTRSAGSWSQTSYIKAPNGAADDAFGVATALSGDGNTLIVGANGEASAATGVGGNQSNNSAAMAGAAYLY